jgi:hypothetical protein
MPWDYKENGLTSVIGVAQDRRKTYEFICISSSMYEHSKKKVWMNTSWPKCVSVLPYFTLNANASELTRTSSVVSVSKWAGPLASRCFIFLLFWEDSRMFSFASVWFLVFRFTLTFTVLTASLSLFLLFFYFSIFCFLLFTFSFQSGHFKFWIIFKYLKIWTFLNFQHFKNLNIF